MTDTVQYTVHSKPSVPYFEDDGFDLENYLSQFDADTRQFVHSLHETGAAKISLGPEAEALIEIALKEVEPLFAGGGRLQDAWRSSPAVRRLALLPDVRVKLAAAYGRHPFAFQTLNFRRGTEQELHSDVVHFSSVPKHFMCGVWIALEDITEDCGPLRYYPGSHRLPHLSMQEAGVTSRTPSEADYRTIWAPEYERRVVASGLPEKALVIKKGEAFVWAANLAHGGHEITNPLSTRRSLVVHFYFEDCVYYAGRSSDEVGDRLSKRLPMDIATGRWRWPRHDGRLASVSPGVLVRSLLRDLIRSVNAVKRPG